MIASDLTQIGARLGAVDDDKLVRIVGMLEAVNHRPGVREAVATVRPRLASLRPSRRPTLVRLFCRPFEDLLIDREDEDLRDGRIPRRLIMPCWRLVEAHADRALMRRLGAALGECECEDERARQMIGVPLWRAAGDTLRAVLERAREDKRARAAAFQGDGPLAHHAATIAEVLEIADVLEGFRQQRPDAPIGALGHADRQALACALVEARRRGPRKPYHLLLVLAARMRNPGDLLQLFGEDDELGSAGGRDLTVMVMANLEHKYRDLGTTPAGTIDVAELAGQVETLAHGLRAMHQAAAVRPDVDASTGCAASCATR